MKISTIILSCLLLMACNATVNCNTADACSQTTEITGNTFNIDRDGLSGLINKVAETAFVPTNLQLYLSDYRDDIKYVYIDNPDNPGTLRFPVDLPSGQYRATMNNAVMFDTTGTYQAQMNGPQIIFDFDNETARLHSFFVGIHHSHRIEDTNANYHQAFQLDQKGFIPFDIENGIFEGQLTVHNSDAWINEMGNQGLSNYLSNEITFRGQVDGQTSQAIVYGTNGVPWFGGIDYPQLDPIR